MLKLSLAAYTGIVFVSCAALLFPSPNVRAQLAQSPVGISEWPKFHSDLGNTGRGVAVGIKGKLKWQFQIPHSSLGGTVLGPNGVLYVGDGRTIYGINTVTGRADSHFQPELDPSVASEKHGASVKLSEMPVMGLGPIGDDSTVYATAVIPLKDVPPGSIQQSYFLRALDGSTGKRRWSCRVQGNILSNPTVGTDGTVYFGSNDHDVYAVDTRTGKKKWHFQTEDFVETCPALGADHTLYITGRDGNLYALDVRTGRKKWVFTTTDVIYASPLIGPDGAVYVASKDGHVYAVNGQTGRKQWDCKFTHVLPGFPAKPSTPAISKDGTLYVGADGGRLYALDAKTGRTRWLLKEAQSKDDILNVSDPIIGGDGVIYWSAGKTLYALDGRTGRQKWTFQAADYIFSEAVLSKKTLYFTSGSNLYALQ